MEAPRKSLVSRVLPFLAPLLALLFVASGAAKLLQMQFEVDAFARFDLPEWVMLMVGAGEVLAGLFLLVPWTTTFGAIMAAAVMLFAVPAHLHTREVMVVPLPLAVLCALVAVGWRRRGRFARLIAPRRG